VATVSLFVQTARVSYRGGWRLDVTRKSGKEGLFLAPSWAILRPALDARTEAAELLKRAAAGCYDPKEAPGDAARIEADAWDRYVPAYLAEMRVSLKANLPQWRAMFARERVVLVCYCTDAERCHRHLLRTRILPTLGAIDGGELP
jgi:hypothetical protein